MRWFLAAFLLLAYPAAAGAQSFNCAYAGKPTEVAICQDPKLGMLDQMMASRYFYLVNNLPWGIAAGIKQDQVAWLRQRDACGYDFACIGASYNFRMMSLCGWQEGNPYLAPCNW